MQLDRACHVPLYGIHFDVNKATLRADADAAMRQILVLMQGSPTLSVELQGHTDSAGDADTNQKLSAARAESVRVWLVQHDVPAARMTAQGYGKTRPVATNDTVEGRARNRRVEIAKIGCK